MPMSHESPASEDRAAGVVEVSAYRLQLSGACEGCTGTCLGPRRAP